jgi:hypothetical protein
MPFTHKSRTGKTYYLHTGPKWGGGSQHFLSTKSSGTLAQKLPDGFEVYETVNGQVYLRRQRPKLIRDDEHQCIARRLAKPPPGHRYKVEIQGKTLTVHESAREFREDLNWLERLSFSRSPKDLEEISERLAHYQPVMRFVLLDTERRLFAPERFCFRGSVDDWISIGAPDTIQNLAGKFVKLLGKDGVYELF